MDLQERQELATGFGDTFSRAVEFVVTPLLFGFLGHYLDGRLGTGRLLTLVLGILAVTAMFLKMYFGYVESMKAHEQRGPWARNPAPTGEHRRA